MPQPARLHQQLQDWLVRIQAGDRAAEDELIHAVQDDVAGLTRKLFKRFPGVQRWLEAEDVLQHVLLRLLRALKQVRPASFDDLLGLAAEQIRRELIDQTRHYYGPRGQGTHQTGAVVGDESSRLAGELEIPARGDDASELENWSAFHEAVAELPTYEREVMSLLFYHGWTQGQLAELFGLTERTVRRHKEAVVAKLQQRLRDKPPDS